MKRITLTFFITLCITASVLAQSDPILWRQTKGPTGGNVTCVCVDSNNIMYVGTQVAGIYRSTNKGDTWQPLNKGLQRLQSKMLVSDGMEHIYGMTYYNEFLRIKEIEKGWEVLPIIVDDSISVSFTAIAAGKNGAIFAATADHGIMRTTDHGDSWHELGDTSFSKLTFLYLAVARNGDIYGIEYVAGKQFNYAYRSTDNGNSWTQLPKEIPGVEAPLSLAIAPDNSIIIGTFWGYVFRSSDGGNSWGQVFHHPDDHDINFILRTNYTSNNAMFFTTHSNLQDLNQTRTGGFYRSTDNGATWELRDGTQHGESKFWISETRDADIFHSSVPLGVIKSNAADQGSLWYDKNNGLLAQFLDGVAVNSKGNIFSVSQFEMTRSTDGGNVWIQLPFISREAFRPPFLYVAQNDLLLHGSYYGLFRSSNDGNSWQQVLYEDTTIHSNLIYDLEQSPVTGKIFASSFVTGLMVSGDQGITWDKVPNLHPDLRFTAIACDNDNTVLCADEASYFWLSENGGINWDNVSPDNNGCSQLTAHPSGAYLARFGFHIDISYDKGRTWQWIFPDSTNAAIRPDWITYTMYVDRHGAIVVSTDSGIFRSKTAPYKEWEFVGKGITAPGYEITHYTNVSQLAQDKSSGVFYAASRGQSIYVSTVDLGVRSSRSHAAARQNYPNPFSGRTLIPLNVKKEGRVIVSISNVIGSYSGVIADEFFGQGQHEISFAGDDLPAGSYLYTIEYPDGSREANMMMLTK